MYSPLIEDLVKFNFSKESPIDDIFQRIDKLRRSAGERFKICPGKCHYGHLILEGMLERPTAISQIDAATDTQESNISLATRTMRLASALHNYGLKVGDTVVVMSPNSLNMSVPFYATSYMGYRLCTMDPAIDPGDVEKIFEVINPKFIFCDKESLKKNKEALHVNIQKAHIVVFDDKENDLEAFIQMYKGSEVNFRPASGFDTSTTTVWLMLTSGTTGTPKVSIITYDALLNAIKEWWIPVPEKVNMNMILISIQWLSSLMYSAAAPIKPYIKLQSSQPMSPQILVHMINDYKPNVTAWTPYLMARFLQMPQGVADLSCFTHILVGGTAPDKLVVEKFKKICKAKLFLAWGMSELLGGIFRVDETTPWGSVGQAMESKYQYKIVDNDGKDVSKEPYKQGELWVKGNYFFKGYLGRPEETKEIITDDGFVKTGDIFYRDENNFYYFVERKKLLIRYLAAWISPLEIEAVIKQHPGVAEACVLAVKNPETMEIAVGAIQKKQGHDFDPQEIFDLVNSKLHNTKRLHGGLFFVDSYPMTASGKINRIQLAKTAESVTRIMPK